MEEKTTDKTMRPWMDCSQSESGGPENQGKNSKGKLFIWTDTDPESCFVDNPFSYNTRLLSRFPPFLIASTTQVRSG